MSEQKKILLVGATGYIGGTLLSTILANKTQSQYSISALIRDSRKAKKLNELGITTILFKGLDDDEANERTASEHDVVINAASSSQPPTSWIRGLSKRQKTTGLDCYFIQTGGTSIMGDHPITKKFVDTKIYSDKEDIYEYELKREKEESYGQRVADIATIQAGEKFGVKTYLVVPPTIYGRGTGPFNTISSQIPNIIRYSLKQKQAVVIGDGAAHWNHVHVVDLADLYILLLRGIISGSSPPPPHGKDGIYWAETGEHTWLGVSQAIAKTAKAQGLIPTEEVKSISLKEAADAFIGGDESYVEVVLASNSRTKAEKARELLGWDPKRGNEDFWGSFEDEVRVVNEERGSVKIGYA